MEQIKFDLSEIKYCSYCDKCSIDYKKECPGPGCSCCEFYVERDEVLDSEGNYLIDEFGEDMDYFHSWCMFHNCMTSPENSVCKQFR